MMFRLYWTCFMNATLRTEAVPVNNPAPKISAIGRTCFVAARMPHIPEVRQSQIMAAHATNTTQATDAGKAEGLMATAKPQRTPSKKFDPKLRPDRGR